MTNPTLGFAAQAALGFIAGLVVGAAYFASLWWNTRLFTAGSAGKKPLLYSWDESLRRSPH